MRFFACWLAVLLLALASQSSAARNTPDKPPFPLRGYYMILNRAPTFDLEAWKQIVDCAHADGANTLILWMAGGFRSKKFPETWEHNREHANVRQDFVRTLIDYAHEREIKILLGVTPFGYDGVNRMAMTHPTWKALGPEGGPTKRFGIHCWGYNLCPAREDTQKFMQEYVREMYFDFYPNADGLFIESSDYAICHSADCKERYFDHEFRYVREISDAVWKRKPKATIVVYPHYFTGAKLSLFNVTAAKQPFDPRWTVFFTPHSANPDASLIAKAANAIWWDESPVLRTPWAVRDGARKAKQLGCSYVPTLEAYNYVATDPEEGWNYVVGKRQASMSIGWIKPEQHPYNELPIRVNRIAFREYTRNPDLSDAAFRAVLGRELFGSAANPQAIEDALALQEICVLERSWCLASPLVDPERVREMQQTGRLNDEKKAQYRRFLERVRQIEARYSAEDKPFAELRRISRWLLDRWTGDNAGLLVGKAD